MSTETKEVATTETKKAYMEVPAALPEITFFEAKLKKSLPSPFSYEIDANGYIVLKYSFTGITLKGNFLGREVLPVNGKVVLAYLIDLAEPEFIDAVEAIRTKILEQQKSVQKEAIPLLGTVQTESTQTEATQTEAAPEEKSASKAKKTSKKKPKK